MKGGIDPTNTHMQDYFHYLTETVDWCFLMCSWLTSTLKKKSKTGAAASPRRQQEPSPSSPPRPAHRHSGLHGVKNPNQLTNKTENGFAGNCLGYSKKPFLSGVLGQLELFELVFFFPLPEADWLSDTDFFVQRSALMATCLKTVCGITFGVIKLCWLKIF